MKSAKPPDPTTSLLEERSREALLARVTEATNTLDRDELVAFLVDVLSRFGSDVDRLKERIAALVAEQYGAKSKRSSVAQLAMFAATIAAIRAEAANAAAGSAEPKPDVPALIDQTNGEIKALEALKREQRRTEQEQRRAAKQAARDAAKAEGTAATGPWPTNFPIEEETVDVESGACSCPDCKCERVVIKRETTWRIERKVAVTVVLTHRLTRACPNHHGGPVTAPVPPKPVDKGHIGFSLAAYAIFLRFAHNLPIRRVSEILSAEGVEVSETMLHTLFNVTAHRMDPVMVALMWQVRNAALVNLDDTPVRVLDPKHPKGSRQGRVWLALGDGRWAWFFGTPNWSAEAAKKHLGKIKGVLQGDGYKGFQKMAYEQGIKLAGCMAHLRRKLTKAMEAYDPRATEALALIAALYRVEQLARLQKLDVEGLVALRRARSVPLMDALGAWAVKVAPSVEPGSPLGKAWTYLNNQWKYLRTYLDDGHVSIDNNAAERGLRRITIGRKLWLFFRGDVTVERAATLASVLTTARLHGAEELAYLEWLLRELARREWSASAAVALLPDTWLAAQEQQREQGSAVEA